MNVPNKNNTLVVKPKKKHIEFVLQMFYENSDGFLLPDDIHLDEEVEWIHIVRKK